jgi:sarcosine oxidase
MPGGKAHIAVVGAGAFGGWTALHLARSGARVTLLDGWGPGNPRASSGGESRIIRASYGKNHTFAEMAVRALQLWQKEQQRWGRQVFYKTGVLWMAGGDDAYERDSLALLREIGRQCQELGRSELLPRYPQINLEGVRWAIFEPEAGFLRANLACRYVVESMTAEGGEYRQVAAEPLNVDQEIAGGLRLSDGSRLSADRYVFGCGPWMGRLFPELLAGLVRATRQEVFFFGTPPGDQRFDIGQMPVWADHRERFYYGMPAGLGRGFKVADDTRGADFDPSSNDRVISPEGLQAARDYVGFRFPALRGAPLVESRVCQYENTPDESFIIDRHPRAANVWLVCGGSGHGFKHGPAVGEMVSRCVLRDEGADPAFSLARFPAETKTTGSG